MVKTKIHIIFSLNMKWNQFGQRRDVSQSAIDEQGEQTLKPALDSDFFS